ncbi:MAG: 1-acyl-sn-glycerol-3-phosphate acyltransferase [Salinivirgaceae bacterium]|jgi:1-acyl-sn-glycerol-3-phosphate acyltransferase|nr:1-acyl-sn-glycerol-3-phosphate acyltransferase [Salinivirgaceae bacterium]
MAMIKPRHTAFYVWFYHLFARLAINRSFHDVKVHMPAIVAERSLLVLSNHHSWWDGFWVLNINRQLFQKQFHVMMLKSQLKKHKTFAHIGAFSIEKGTRTVYETLGFAANLLNNSANMLLMFPQGKLQSQHAGHIRFERGVQYLLKQNAEVLMLAFFTDYLQNRKPTLYVYGELLEDKQNAEVLYNQFYERCKRRQEGLWR